MVWNMSTTEQGTSATIPRWHSIREASLFSGLPESTLRYYEQIGIIGSIARDPSSGHRMYSDSDLESLDIIACLSATGMPLDDMRAYLNNRFDGKEGARAQVELLDAQAIRLSARMEALKIQQAYVNLKSMYWAAVADGRDEDAARLLDEHHELIDQVKRSSLK